jgi:5-methylcytosine-specific restriction endonuclease McrA
MRILCLNKNWVPIRTASIYSVIGKMYCGLADGIFFEGENFYPLNFENWLEKSLYDVWPKNQRFIQSVKQRVAVPSVVMYVKYGGVPKVTLKLTRKAIYERDHYICYICGKEFSESKLTLDHVIPISRGGQNSWNNLATCCQQCNWDKGDHLLSELNIRPHYIPQKPLVSNISRLKASITEYKEEWKYFIS